MSLEGNLARKIVDSEVATELLLENAPTERISKDHRRPRQFGLHVIDGGRDDQFPMAEPVISGADLQLVPGLVSGVEQSEAAPKKKRWYDMIQSVQKKYQEFKQGLIERTNVTLSAVATEYVERYEAARNPKTGEVPNSLFRRLTRAAESIRSSVSLRSSFELIGRGALQPLEFGTKMAFMQFGVDLAARQADYESTRHKYEQQGLNENAIELQALTFAQEVREQFERLSSLQKELPVDAENSEPQRQQRIQEGVLYAQQLLQGMDWVDPTAQQRILQEVQTYLDITVFGEANTSLWSRWVATGSDSTKQLHEIIKRNIDLYQKKKARNMSAITTTARWLTLGAESMIVQNAYAAYSSVNKNYERTLQALPVAEREQVSKMTIFGKAVQESLVQFVGMDRYRALRAESTQVDTLVDSLISSAGVDREQLKTELQARYGAELAKRELGLEWLDTQIDNITGNVEQQRTQLAHLIWYRLQRLQEKYIKATASHTEHLYQKYLTTVAAVGVAASIDTAIENRFGVREAVSTELEQVSQGRVDIEIPTGDIKGIHNTLEHEPHVEAADAVIGLIDRHIQDLQEQRANLETVDQTSLATTNSETYWASEANETQEDPKPLTVITDYTVQSGDSLWKIAQHHLDTYRLQEHNSALTVNDVMRFIQADNHLAKNHVFHPGDTLQLPTFNTAEAAESYLPLETGVNTKLDTARYVAAANQVEAGQVPKDYIPNMSRETLKNLPHGEYVVVLGERYSRGNSTPEHYSTAVVLRHTAEGMTVQAENNSEAEPLTLEEFLNKHQNPIVRVFVNEGEVRELPVEHLNPEQWSQRTHTLIESLKTNPIQVLDNRNAECAKHLGRMYNNIDPQLGEFVGIQTLDKHGESTGMTVPAPMLAQALIARGGQELVNLEQFFTASSGEVRSTETLASTNPEYRVAVNEWITQAARSPLEVVTALYDFTQIKHIIKANETIGGQSNSHGMISLGEAAVAIEVTHDVTMQQWFREQHHIPAKVLEQRGWLFESLGIDISTPNGKIHRITNETDWQHITIHSGDRVVIHDVMVNHRYHISLEDLHPKEIDRSDLLVTNLLVREGFLKPVSVIEPNAVLLNETLSQTEVDSSLIVTDFHQLQVGETLGDVLRHYHYPRDLYTAIQFVWQQEDKLQLDQVRNGRMIPIYDPEVIRERLYDIYETQEQYLAQAENNPRLHIIRPGEGMDSILGHYGYERSLYSSDEWNYLKEQLAERLRQDTGGKISVAEVMVGNSNQPTLQYNIAADTVLRLNDQEFFDNLDLQLFEQHRAARMFIPETLPIRTEDGIIETTIPAEIRERIDRVMDRNPEYGEPIRTALASVFANENMRENIGVDKSWLGEQWSYLTSRRLLKDVAWGIKDVDIISNYLDKVILTTRLMKDWPVVHPLMEKLLSVEEKIAGVSSAGDFQVRASNFRHDRESAEYQEFEQALRDDPDFNIKMAADLLQMNSEIVRLHAQAFNDPLMNDKSAHTLAIVAAHNGGMGKVLLGGFQDGLIRLSDAAGLSVEDSLFTKATGRGIEDTRAAMVAMCRELIAQGNLHIDVEQVEQDAQLLGSDTIHFWETSTVQALKLAYHDKVGEDMTILPQESQLKSVLSTHSNYALLVSPAMHAIQDYSQRERAKLYDLPTPAVEPTSANEAIAEVRDDNTPLSVSL